MIYDLAANQAKYKRTGDQPLPTLPDLHAFVVMGLSCAALYLFSREHIRAEATSLWVLLALALIFYLYPYDDFRPADIFANFGHEGLVTVCALMVLGQGLDRTGAMQPLVTVLARTWVRRPRFALFVTLVTSWATSGFINDTPQIVMLIPVLVACSLRAGKAPSNVLLPMGMAVLLGGMTTTIGSGTNILAVGIASEFGMSIGMFDFFVPAAVGGAVGLLYLWLVAPRLLPVRKPLTSESSPRLFNAVLHVKATGFAAGRTLAEVRKRTEQRMRIDRISRGDGLLPVKEPSVQLQAGDRLYVRDTADNLKNYERLLGATLYNTSDVGTPVSAGVPLDEEGQQLAEAVISRSSPLHNRTLNAAHFSTLYNLVPLAIHRTMSGADLSEDLSNIRLQAGDVLLVQGARDAIAELRSSGSILVLDGTIDLPHTDRAPWALMILLMVVLVAAFGLLPMSLSALVGVAAMLVTRCLRWRDLGPALSLPLILLVTASLSLGDALTVTGAIDYIAKLFVAGFGGMPVPVILSGLMLLLILATNVVTNNTVAVIGVPIAISMAGQLGAPAEPFVVAAIFAANMSYATPIGYQGNLLIMSAGGYKFADFVRVGVPLTILMWLTFSFFLPVWYGL